jgi:hypothetical protein
MFSAPASRFAQNWIGHYKVDYDQPHNCFINMRPGVYYNGKKSIFQSGIILYTRAHFVYQIYEVIE